MLKLEDVELGLGSDDLDGQTIFALCHQVHRIPTIKHCQLRQAVPQFPRPFLPLHQLINQIEIIFLMMKVVLLGMSVGHQEDALEHGLVEGNLLAELAAAAFVVEFVVGAGEGGFGDGREAGQGQHGLFLLYG